MVNKLFKSIFAAVLVISSALGFVACENEGDDVVVDPKVGVSATTLNFTNEEGNQTLEVTANTDWRSETSADWITITPSAGKGDATITIAVSANDTGAVRTAVVKVIGLHKTYGDWDTKRVTVSQSATSAPTVEEVLLYSDNFDKEVATQTYGSDGKRWPYIDQFSGFANPQGPAAKNVTYSGEGVSIRANSTSDSQYSDYDGSGSNNILFGSSAYFQVNNITLAEGQQNLKLTFGSEKYIKDGDSTFKTEEFRIYVSKDGNAWAEIKEYTFAGTEGGRWNVATAEFTLNAVPETLYLKFAATVASAYRLDDVKLYTGNGGQTIDLDNIEAPQPSEAKKVTVAEFLAAAEDSTIYELTGVITRMYRENNDNDTLYGNFYLKDATGEVLIYGLMDKDGNKYWSASGVKIGDTITVQTVRTSYNGTPQGKNATYISHTAGSGETPEPEPTPGEVKKVTVAEFLAAAEDSTIYELTGVITRMYRENNDNDTLYGNFYLKDATGEVLIYGLMDKDGNKYWSASGVKIGDTITVQTVRTSYNGTPQGKNATYISHTAGSGETPEPGPTPGPESAVTIAEAITIADNTAIVIENATVVGIYARGVLVDDTTGKLLVYAGSAVSAKVGDVVKVEGSMATYGGLRQVANPTITVTGSTSYTYPTATVMDGAAMDAYLSNPEIKYVEYTGTLTINGYYYNVAVDGASTAVGSLAYVIEGTVDPALNGQKILVKGWAIGFSGEIYVNTMITSVTAADGTTPTPDPTPDPDPEPTPGDGNVVVLTMADYFSAAENIVNTDGTAKSYKFGDYTFSFKKVNTNTSNYNASDKGIRFYQSDVMKIDAGSKTMTKIEFETYDSKTGPFTSNVGSVVGTTWTGSASSVELTASAQVRFKSVTITLAE